MSMQVALIAAFDSRMTIGRDGDMPWPRPGDLRRFKQLTMGKTVLMGRRTWEGLPGPLPGRTTVVLTRQSDYTADGALIAHDIEQAVELAEQRPGVPELMVAGGAAIYEQFLPRADRLYLTVIYHEFEGDTFFPAFDPGEWLVDERSDRGADEDIDWPHAFFTLVRNREKPMSLLPNPEASSLPDMLAPIDDDSMAIEPE